VAASINETLLGQPPASDTTRTRQSSVASGRPR
jgi:hypothetical protein